MAILPRKCTGVVFATPVKDPVLSIEHSQSLAEMTWHLGRLGIPFSAIKVVGEDHAQARNKLLAMFLEQHPAASDLFWTDDDVGWEPLKAIDWLTREEDVIAAGYRLKDINDKIDFPIELIAGTEGFVEQDGLLGATKVGGGFIRMRRHVAEMLAANCNTFFGLDPHSDARREYPNVFEMGRGPDGAWWPEDFWMCRKWLDLGGEIWVDPSMHLTHRGSRIWAGRMAEHLDLYRAFKQKAAA